MVTKNTKYKSEILTLLNKKLLGLTISNELGYRIEPTSL